VTGRVPASINLLELDLIQFWVEELGKE